MTRFITTTFLLTLISISFTVFAQNKDQKPNFILIVADDLGFADLSLNGSKQIPTPNIDRLAEEGINFIQGYVSAPVCSPSRAGLLTGRNQVHFGHDNNMGGSQPGFDPQYLGLPHSETTIANRLKKLGYFNGLIGKWHLGDEPQFHPLKRGFDEFWGYTGGGHDYFTSEPNGKGYKSPIECNYKTPQPITYITDDKGDECVDFIKRHKNEPFFLFASFNAPHAPMHATEADLELFNHIKNEKRRKYCAMVYRLDVNIGRIMETVEKEGLAENTLIVFISDNGGPVDSNASINAPLNGQKGILLEGGIRVPFIMNWKGKLAFGKTYENPVISLDFAATFFELAGGEVTDDVKFDGVNLMPFLTNIINGVPHKSMNWRFTISAAIRDGNWKLVRLPERFPMLYDLSKDISEQNNVAFENLERTKSMLKKLGDWDVSQPHPVFLEGAVWKARQLNLYDRKYPLAQPD
ncbi:MAG: sulfatase-like hydrolase/transferase [Prolixibacteraceae bacterium]|jgi:arylsulfatase A-like enzyme|nr:sulfatase-like hydrolase/transferase [Prolixibacteraceae bacterium]MBT6007407.1 sulfatase-like hydrolase/transferase [Prolixibacteraceae bacterium]MBT6999708.1 sulfatase-like hydrolase/transferase [Prolixibacteraceae bacterium]MBT7394073.1 sulfatase-like hydrolase/transferase [Prolixibacteraceae bacterium]